MATHSLESVSVHGFRGLRNFRLDGLHRVNVLVGENNSGKTSVLEALSILSNPLDPYEWGLLARKRDFGGLDEDIDFHPIAGREDDRLFDVRTGVEGGERVWKGMLRAA